MRAVFRRAVYVCDEVDGRGEQAVVSSASFGEGCLPNVRYAAYCYRAATVLLHTAACRCAAVIV